MAINESIWGAPETWVDSRNNSDLDDAEIKVGATGYSTFADQYTAERIALNDIDISPCFWGISSDSMWGNMYAAYAYAPDGLENPIEIGEKLVTETHENSLPLMLIDSTMSSPLQYGLGYQKRYTPVESNLMTDQSPYTRDVVLNFNYQKIMCIPHLVVMDTSFNKVFTTFEAYFDENYDYYRTTYPYITAITYGMYLGAAGSRIGESSGIVPLIPYTFLGSNEQYEARYEFSANGFSALKTSYITNDTNAGVILSCDNTGDEITVSYNTPNATVATDETAYRYRYCVNEPDRDEFYTVPLYVRDDSGLWEYIRSSSVWWNISCVIDIRNNDLGDVREYCLKQIAYLGFPFVIAYADRQKAIGTAGVYLPVFDENGVTTGDYIEGVDALDLPNADWTDGRSSGYDPNRPPTPESGDYGYLDNKSTSSRVYSSNNRVYALTEAQYSQFIKDVNSLYLDDPDGFDNFQLDFKGTNPADYIVGTYGYTFLPAGLIPNQTPESIQLGAATLPNAEGYRIAPSYIYNYKSLGTIDLTGAGLYKPFGDFRDFEPYTHIELYVPLCGNIVLDPAAVVGHTISIDLHFDIMTGNATACVYRDNQTLIATIAGQLAASLPLSSARMGDYQNAVKSAENALKQNELRTLTTAATVAISVGAALLAPETGGLSLAAGAAAIGAGSSLMSLNNQKSQIEYDITHKQPTISVCSAANGAVAQNISSMYAVCYVKQCKMLSTYNADEYAHTIGHACVINGTIGGQVTTSKDSLLVCSNVALSGITATAAEISAIQNLLTSGVYV